MEFVFLTLSACTGLLTPNIFKKLIRGDRGAIRLSYPFYRLKNNHFWLSYQFSKKKVASKIWNLTKFHNPPYTSFFKTFECLGAFDRRVRSAHYQAVRLYVIRNGSDFVKCSPNRAYVRASYRRTVRYFS